MSVPVVSRMICPAGTPKLISRSAITSASGGPYRPCSTRRQVGRQPGRRTRSAACVRCSSARLGWPSGRTAAPKMMTTVTAAAPAARGSAPTGRHRRRARPAANAPARRVRPAPRRIAATLRSPSTRRRIARARCGSATGTRRPLERERQRAVRRGSAGPAPRRHLPQHRHGVRRHGIGRRRGRRPRARSRRRGCSCCRQRLGQRGAADRVQSGDPGAQPRVRQETAGS